MLELTVVFPSRNVTVSVFRFSIPLDIAVDHIFTVVDINGLKNGGRWFNVTVNSIVYGSLCPLIMQIS